MHTETYALADYFSAQIQNPDATLKTYLLEAPARALAGKPRPLILICPGGGYLYISDRESEPAALRFASMGYHVAVLQYSVNTPHPVPVIELAAAVLLAKREASHWNVNPNQLILCGFSAGGHVCALYGAYWNQPLLCDLFNRPADDFQVAASILGYPVTNYVEMEHAPETPEIADYYQRAQQALFGDVPLTYDLLEAVSPTLLAEATIPPTFLWGTTQDKLVPVLQSTGYIHALATHHVPFEAHIFESGPHGLVLADPSTAVYEDQVSEEAAKWVDLVRAWLRKRFEPTWIKKEST